MTCTTLLVTGASIGRILRVFNREVAEA